MRVRFAGVVSALALGALVGCSADTEGTLPPGVDSDTGTTDTGVRDTTVTPTDSGMEEDTATEDTGTTDTGSADTGSADATDTSIPDVADTAVVDAADSAVVDSADTAMTDADDVGTPTDAAVTDATDAAGDVVTDVGGDAGTGLPSMEVWVTRVGDGTTTLSNASSAVVIEKFQLATGASLGTIPMPIAASGSNQPLTYSGTATSEGALARSGDGKYVTLAGYGVAPGLASVANQPTSSDAGTAVLRVIGRVDAAGTVDTSTTTLSHSGNNIRGATSFDGTQYWSFGGSDGIVYLTHGTSAMAGTPISSPLANVRVGTLFENGALWGSTSSGSTYRVFNFGTTARPTTATTPVAPAGLPTTGGSPYGIAGIATGTTADIDTVYVCDDGGGTAGGIWRYKATSGTFAAGERLTTVACRGLAAMKASMNVYLVAVTAENPSRVIAVADTTVGLTTGTIIPIATAAANTQYRGAAFAPVP